MFVRTGWWRTQSGQTGLRLAASRGYVKYTRGLVPRFTCICEITETIWGQMGARVPGLRLGNEDLQSVSTDAKREESTKPREANEKHLEAFMQSREGAVKVHRSEEQEPMSALPVSPRGCRTSRTAVTSLEREAKRSGRRA
jgi:hypothetical protein